MDGELGECMDRKADGWTKRRLEGTVDKLIYGWMAGWMGGWIAGD